MTENIFVVRPQDLNHSINPHIKLCLCPLCDNIVMRAMMFIPCQHTFCLGCIIPKIRGQPQNNVKCFVCEQQVNTICASKRIEDLVRTLNVECRNKGCPKLFKFNELQERSQHEITCSHYNNIQSPTTVKEMMAVVAK